MSESQLLSSKLPNFLKPTKLLSSKTLNLPSRLLNFPGIRLILPSHHRVILLSHQNPNSGTDPVVKAVNLGIKASTDNHLGQSELTKRWSFTLVVATVVIKAPVSQLISRRFSKQSSFVRTLPSLPNIVCMAISVPNADELSRLNCLLVLSKVNGTIVSDFFSAYVKYANKIQSAFGGSGSFDSGHQISYDSA